MPVRAPADAFASLLARVTGGDGVTPAAQRAQAAGAGAVDGAPAVAAFVAKVRDHAYRITDDDVAALRAAGLDDDHVYELTCAAAAGVAARRLDAARAAMDAHAAAPAGDAEDAAADAAAAPGARTGTGA
ncbi:MAG: hypothetical protein H6709_14250 [Kofleriaceae bacterium]|nr:hypothetical protein [Kofleriaceae bacterium]MCB9573243.1 hypothetical protein [Kofleriaceae bacterium]